MPKLQRQPLTEKQVKFVKAKVEGKSNTEAAMIATGAKTKDVAKTQGHRLSTNVNVQEAVAEALLAKGVDLNMVLDPVVKALTAKHKVKLKSEEGEYITELDIDDLELQLKGHDRAVKLLGLIPSQQGGSSVTINYIEISTNQREKYGIGK